MKGKHTCSTAERTGCELCVQLEDDLWAAINRYAIAVGGDPGSHVYGNVPRMQAVDDIGKIVDHVAARQRIDDLVADELVKACDAAAARGPAYETAKKLAHMWRNDRIASFELLDRLVQDFNVGGGA